MDKERKRKQAVWINVMQVDIKQRQKAGYTGCVDNFVQTVHKAKVQINQGKKNSRIKAYSQEKKNLSTSYQQTVDKLRQPDKLSTSVDNFVDKKKTGYPQRCAENCCLGGKIPKCKKFKDLLDESRFFEYN